MVLDKLRRVMDSRLAQNALAMYAVQILTYVSPLIVMPYLAATLKPVAFGLVAFGQSFALWLSVVGEYGFNYSATRALAHMRERREAVATLAASVIGAKLMLLVGMFLATLGVVQVVEAFRGEPLLVWFCFLIAAGWTLSPAWYFQAVERAWVTAILEAGGRLIQLAGIFIFVQDPSDGWKAIAAQAASTCFSAAVGLYLMYREIPFRPPQFLTSWLALKVSFSLFLARASSSFYTAANGFILGLITSPVQVGLYSPAERLIQPGISLLGPLSNAIYPRISHLMARDPQAAARLSRLAFLGSLGIGLVGGVLLALLAPFLIRLLFPGYEAAIPVLQVMALLLPVVGMRTSLSVQYMFPRRMDREFTWSVVVAGVVNIGLALLLAPSMGALGMGIAVISAETAALVVIVFVLKQRKIL